MTTKIDPKISGQTQYVTPELTKAVKLMFEFFQKTEKQIVVFQGPNMEILVISNNPDVIDHNLIMLHDINDGRCPGCGQVHEKGKDHVTAVDDKTEELN